MKIIITGATGTAGSEALRQALVHPQVEKVTILTRRPLPTYIIPVSTVQSNPKLDVILHSDFNSYPVDLLDKLKGYNGVLWDLGKSSIGMKESDYEVMTKDYALAAAKAFSTLPQPPGKKFVFAYLSGEGTDQEEKSWTMFGRIKGRAEKALALLSSEDQTTSSKLATYSFRPAGILPIHFTPETGRALRLANSLYPVLRPIYPSMFIKTDVLATGMLEACLKGTSGSIPGWDGKGQVGNHNVFSNEEIKRLAASAKDT